MLVGFRERLITRHRWGNNLPWDAHVLREAFPDVDAPLTGAHATSENQKHAIDVMFDLIEELERARSEHDGLKRIFLAYERWLQQQRWYDPKKKTKKRKP